MTRFLSSTKSRKRQRRAQRKREAGIERWLREEVAPVAVAMQADPTRAISDDQVFDEIRALHAQHTKSSDEKA
jgi:antitoxin ParD1/3/4